MSQIRSDHRKLLQPLVTVIVATLLALVLVATGETAYQGERPISNGVINQAYLWSVAGGGTTHRGIDFSYNTGTNVLAVANGLVVDLEENRANGEEVTINGNFVVIQHSKRHYDADLDSIAYVYSIFLHLSEGTVVPNIGEQVTAGTVIAQSDDTGNSTGPHLHYQLVLHPEAQRTLEPHTLDSDNRSRNPELWLTPLTARGTVAGKVTDANGVSVEGLIICGLRKGGQARSIQTYPLAQWANPDDLLDENFGTTDVDTSPGVYTLYANQRAAGCGATPHAYELGTHQIKSDKVTYIGLYPSWLPVLRPTPSWDMLGYPLTHETSPVSARTVTYFGPTQPEQQWRSTAVSYSSTLLGAEIPDLWSGLVVPSQDSSLLELINYAGQPAGTTSVTALTGRGAPGWERAGTTLYVPLVKDNSFGRRTQIFVANTGNKDTLVHVTYYRGDGQPFPAHDFTLAPNLRREIHAWTYIPDGNIYSAVITSDDQPLAAFALEQTNQTPHDAPALYNAFSSGNETLYAPLVKKNYFGNTSGITLQNINNSTVTFQASYYDGASGQLQGTVTDSIPAHAPYVLYNPAGIPDGFVGAVRVTSSNKLVGEVSEESRYGTDPRLIYNMALEGSTNIYLPVWYEEVGPPYNDWTSGVNVHNAGSGNNQVTVSWYWLETGNFATSQTVTLAERATYTFYNPPTLPNEFVGSVRIHSGSNKPIVAASNIHYWGASGDSALSFTGSNR